MVGVEALAMTTASPPYALHFFLLMFSGWVNRQQQQAIDYLLEENRILREQLGGRRLRLTDDQRRRLAVKGKLLGRKILGQLAGIVTPDTILRWYRRLVAKKYDGSGRFPMSRPEWDVARRCHEADTDGVYVIPRVFHADTSPRIGDMLIDLFAAHRRGEVRLAERDLW